LLIRIPEELRDAAEGVGGSPGLNQQAMNPC
jgi:hypothetical protein